MAATFNSSVFRQELRAIAVLGLPVIGTKLANMAIRITDTIMAGNISVRQLAAVAVGNGYSGTLMVFLTGTLIAMNPIIGQLQGAKCHEEIGEKFRQGLWLSLFLGMIAVIGLHQVNRLMAGLDSTLAPVADSYLKATCWGTPFLLVFHLLKNVNVAMGKTKPAFYIILASIPLNIIGNLLFMHGYLGLPKMGARGLGYASSLTWIFMFAAMLFWTYRHRDHARLNLWKWVLPRWSGLREILGLGVPIGLSIAFEAGLYSATMILVGGLGSQMVAAHAITVSISNVIYMIPAGIATAIGIRVSQARGRKNNKAVLLAGKTGILLAGCVMAGCALFTLHFSHVLVGFYTNDPALAKTTMGLLALAALYQVFDGLQVTANAALNGLKDTRIPMLASAISFWCIGLPIGWYLGIVQGMAASGFWIGLLSGLFSAAVLHNFRFYCLTHPVSSRRLVLAVALRLHGCVVSFQSAFGSKMNSVVAQRFGDIRERVPFSLKRDDVNRERAYGQTSYANPFGAGREQSGFYQSKEGALVNDCGKSFAKGSNKFTEITRKLSDLKVRIVHFLERSTGISEYWDPLRI